MVYVASASTPEQCYYASCLGPTCGEICFLFVMFGPTELCTWLPFFFIFRTVPPRGIVSLNFSFEFFFRFSKLLGAHVST